MLPIASGPSDPEPGRSQLRDRDPCWANHHFWFKPPHGPMFWGLNHVKSFLIWLNACWAIPFKILFTDFLICSVHWLRDLLWLKSPCFFGSTLWFYTNRFTRASFWTLARPPFGLSRAGHAFHAQLQDVALLHWVHFTAELSRTLWIGCFVMFRDVSWCFVQRVETKWGKRTTGLNSTSCMHKNNLQDCGEDQRLIQLDCVTQWRYDNGI